jgi:ATP-dependent RNA helicase RhlE
LEAFKSLGITAQFVRPLVENGIETPTEIQALAIPKALTQKDIIAVAPTGTGKTLAFVLPMLMKLKYRKDLGVRGLILLPSKELAVQVSGILDMVIQQCDLKHVLLYGGVGRTNQINALNEKPDIIVATPARFKDMYYAGFVDVRKLEVLVLDEADRMLDGGFITQLRDIFEVIPSKRQNLLFSATFGEKVQTLVDEFLLNPTYLEVSAPRVKKNITQQIAYLENRMTKVKALEAMLTNPESTRVLVFCKSKESAKQTFAYLDRKFQYECGIITSNKSQSARLEAFEKLNDGVNRILITTDVCARGIDISDVSHVVQMDVARDSDEFLHRSGRTGRMEKEGTNITFCSDNEKYYFKKITDDLKLTTEVINIEVGKHDYLPGEKHEEDRELDMQKQKDDPDYRGAFHKKKKIYGRKKFFKK